MPKLKSNRGAAKRFKKTAGGYRLTQSHRRHLLTHKTSKRKRQLRKAAMVHPSDVAAVAQMLPYS